MATKIFGDLIVTGTITAAQINAPNGSLTNSAFSSSAAIARSKLAQDALQPFAIDLADVRVHDALATRLPNTAASDDLALVPGTFGSDAVHISAGDCKAATVTRYGRFLVALPAEYDQGQTAKIRVWGGMVTTVADTSAVMDVECYAPDKEGALSADICSTAATDINGLGIVDRDFEISGGSPLSPGDILDVRITISVVDSATGTTVEPRIYALELVCDIKG